eukprot:555731-Pyramimonas_sp.AAC.1
MLSPASQSCMPGWLLKVARDGTVPFMYDIQKEVKVPKPADMPEDAFWPDTPMRMVELMRNPEFTARWH